MTLMTRHVAAHVAFMAIGVNNMKGFLNVFGSCALFVGIIAIAGSGNDCDGRCMETANTISEMLVVVGYGLISCIGGAACILTAQKLDD